MAFNLFGFQLNTKKDKTAKEDIKSFAAPDNDDGSFVVDVGGGYYNQAANFGTNFTNEIDLIRKYRQVGNTPEGEDAIEEVVNEAIATESNSVAIDLDNVEGMSESIKETIRDEFDEILNMLDWDNRAYDIFRSWYIDARLYYHKIIDDKAPKKGILELRKIDPISIRKVKEFKRTPGEGGVELVSLEDEYYLYNKFGIMSYSAQAPRLGTRISVDSIAFINSGLFNESKTQIMGHLHKAIKPLNQLSMMEDASVIYRITRAPERRIFYIDVGNLPTQKAESYVKAMMQKFKSKLVYNSSTGEVKDITNVQSMNEDFWLPRREGQRGTEVSTLQGGQNLGITEDIEYFRKKFLRALKVPYSRINGEGTFNLGRSSEISRDEIKFTKFTKRLRKRFSGLFDDLLRTQLLLKNILKAEEWDAIKEAVQYRWEEDNQFAELKKFEMMKERMAVVQDMDQYVGKYVSLMYIRKQILGQSDEEVEQIDKEIDAEKEHINALDKVGLMSKPGTPSVPFGGEEDEEGIEDYEYPGSNPSN